MSSTEQLVDLVNRVVDGEASAAEEAELQRLMRDSTEARILFAETRDIFRRLDGLPELDPPHQLRNETLASIQQTNFPPAGLYLPLTVKTRGGNMSADRRKQMLIGFAGLAAVLVGTFIFVSPSYRPEDASGAIGAVQKHRETQIAPQDVVLGNEQVKEEQQIAYADVLEGSAALQNISADLAIGARSNNARVELAAIDSALDARISKVEARYSANAKAALDAMKKVMAADAGSFDAKKLEAMRAEADAIGARLQARLSASDMESLNARLSAIHSALEARVSASSLDAISKNVAGISAQLDSDTNLEAASRNLMKAESALEARSGVTVAARMSYADSAALEARTLWNAKSKLDATSKQSLAARADAISADMAARAATLEARAVSAMQARLASDEADASALGRMKLTLDALRKSVDARPNLEARQVSAFSRSVESFNARIQAQARNLEGRSQLERSVQLAAINAQLGARDNLNARITSSLGAKNYLAAALPDASELGRRAADLAARSVGAKSVDAKNLEAKQLEAKQLGAAKKVDSRSQQ